MRHAIVIVAALVGFSGCTMLALQEEVELLDHAVRLQGHLRNPSPNKKPVVVLLYQVLPDKKKLVSYSIHHRPDRFEFLVLPGQYILSAFEDANEDLTYQESEYAGYYGEPTVVALLPGKEQLTLDMTLQLPGDLILKESPNLSSPATKANLNLPNIKIGEVVTIADERFVEENGRMGLWEPIRFLLEIGGGLYFLEPFDQNKIPVVFVHGAGGFPQIWKPIIQELDRSRFQPWIFFYPSGLRLKLATEFLRETLSETYLKHKFQRMIIVAHSMGGLVSRAFMNILIHKDVQRQGSLLFISISTPWNGHQAAQSGVNYSPAVIPSWIDMSPGSPFQRALFETTLPPNIRYYLFFGFKSGRNPFTNGSDDGTVSLVSQLKRAAQEEAVKVFGFNEDHSSILRSSQLMDKVNDIMNDYYENANTNS